MLLELREEGTRKGTAHSAGALARQSAEHKRKRQRIEAASPAVEQSSGGGSTDTGDRPNVQEVG